MGSNEDLNKQLEEIEARLTALEEGDGSSLPWYQKIFSMTGLKNLMYLLGLPVLTVVTYQAFDEKIWNKDKYQAAEEQSIAVEKINQLQDFNSEIYVLQVQGGEQVAFAKIEAKRGQIERVTNEVYEVWNEYPSFLGRHEKNTLAEALLTQGKTDQAISVANSVDTGSLDTIAKADQHLLRARILFADGPGYDIEAARHEIREAVKLSETLPRVGQKWGMLEKITAVRVINEAWRGTPCEKVLPMAASLKAVVGITPLPEGSADSVRANSLATLPVVEARCGEIPELEAD